MGLKDAIVDLQTGEYSTGWAIFNRLRTTRTVAKTDLIIARNSLGAALIRQKELNRDLQTSDFYDEHNLEALERENDLAIAVHMLKVAINETEIVKTQSETYLTRRAAEGDLTLPNHQEIKKITIIEEHKVEMEFRKVMNTLAAISKFKHLEFEAFDEIRGRLDALIVDLHRIQNSDLPDEVKRDQIEIAQGAIEAYKAVFNAQRNRLVEAGNGEGLQGLNAITQLGLGSGEGSEAISNVLPVRIKSRVNDLQ